MVVPAKHEEPGLLKASNPVPEQHPNYLVPGPVRQPKHLFHFIIRYEGEGIIDPNVVEAIKAQNSQNSSVAPTPPMLPPNLTQGTEPTATLPACENDKK